MPYATAQDMSDRYGEDTVLRLSDRNGDDQADEHVLTQALNDATAEIDTYLAMRYSTPMTPVPSVLTRLCIDIAVYRLASSADMATEEQRTRYEDALTLLDKIAKGQVLLGAPAIANTTAGSAHLVTQAKRFSRGRIL